jgi:hypothetical protein
MANHLSDYQMLQLHDSLEALVHKVGNPTTGETSSEQLLRIHVHGAWLAAKAIRDERNP